MADGAFPASRDKRRRVAVVGSGISGLSAAWLLQTSCDVVLFEAETRLGGHSHTVAIEIGNSGPFPVDTGFIVYNPQNYPNLIRLFDALDVPTALSDMSFAASVRQGDLEYGSSSPAGLLAGGANLLKPRFWSMIAELIRFYREATALALSETDLDMSLGQFLRDRKFGSAFVEDHILPMGAAIWSSGVTAVEDFPLTSFVRFFHNHGLLKLTNRPLWRTVTGGSRTYVNALRGRLGEGVRTGCSVSSVRRTAGRVELGLANGELAIFDDVVLANHAPDALRLIDQPTLEETEILSAIRYAPNRVVLHTDPSQMPANRKVWSSWNVMGGPADAPPCVTYWMNKLQSLPTTTPVLVTLNPVTQIDPATILREFSYDHPQFDLPALKAQRRLWDIQGKSGLWFCGAWAGSGFHEDGIQSGLAVAEQLGGVARPWTVEGANARLPGYRRGTTGAAPSGAAA